MKCKKERKMRMSAYCVKCKGEIEPHFKKKHPELYQTFNEKLEAAQKEFDGGAEFDKRAMPEVLAHCKAAQAADKEKYRYNRALAEYIKEREVIDLNMLAGYLDTEVYLAQHDIRTEREAANMETMKAAGWRVLDKAAIDEAIATGKRLQVSATITNDWFSAKMDNIYKPCIFNKGEEHEHYGLMKPRARRKGYALHQFENAFCKIV